jgi:hypothetical protein
MYAFPGGWPSVMMKYDWIRLYMVIGIGAVCIQTLLYTFLGAKTAWTSTAAAKKQLIARISLSITWSSFDLEIWKFFKRDRRINLGERSVSESSLKNCSVSGVAGRRKINGLSQQQVLNGPLLTES